MASATTGLLKSLTGHIPPGQFARYLLVGIWNTGFGYASFAILTMILDRRFANGYILASFFSSLLSITVAYLGYKVFVFRTKGNYLREWLRCVAVYSVGIIAGLILLPIVVALIRASTPYHAGAPYIAGALITVLSVIYNFIGHKKFSFQGA